MLQPVLQLPLLLWRKSTKLRIALKSAPLLGGGEILVAAQPRAGVPRLVWRMGFISAIGGAIRGGPIRSPSLLKVVPLAVCIFRLRVRAVLREHRRQQQERCRTAQDLCPAQHALIRHHSQKILNWPLQTRPARLLWICGYVVLHLQIVEHVKIGIQIIVAIESLQIADSGTRLHGQT